MIFLSVSTKQLMHWLFTTEIPSVTKRISHFMGFFATESTLEAQFAPALIFNLWRDGSRWPKAQNYLREMTIPCAHELALQDSDRVISSPHLRVQLKTLSIHKLRELLHPTKLVEIIKELAPFTWGILHTFSASPNKARKQRKTDEDVPMPPSAGVEEDWADDPNDDENVEEGEANPSSIPKRQWSKEYPRFSRNPVFVYFENVGLRHETNLLYLGHSLDNIYAGVCPQSCHKCPSTHTRTVLQNIGHQFPCCDNAEQCWCLCIKSHCRTSQGSHHGRCHSTGCRTYHQWPSFLHHLR